MRVFVRACLCMCVCVCVREMEEGGSGSGIHCDETAPVGQTSAIEIYCKTSAVEMSSLSLQLASLRMSFVKGRTLAARDKELHGSSGNEKGLHWPEGLSLSAPPIVAGCF